MKKIKVLELFGGIGACTQALKNIGVDYEIADYVEIDKFAVRSYNAMNNSNFLPQDITTWDKDLEVDLIMHGSPCQDFSLAGRQAGGDKDSGTRSSLMYETIRIVEKLKPKYVIWENVKNLLSKKHKHNFDAYIETMKDLGYDNYYKVLNAKDFGVPQNRERVFTVSILNDSKYEFPEEKELTLKLKDILEKDVEEKYYLSDKMINYVLDENDVCTNSNYKKNINNEYINPCIARTISCRGAIDQRAGTTNFVINGTNNEIKVGEYKQYLKIKNATKKGYLEAQEGDGKDISSRMQYHRGTVQKGMIQTLDTQATKGVVVKEINKNAKHQQDLVQSAETICRTIPAGTHGSTPHLLKTVVSTKPLRIRKLTPKECWRLMGFPDSSFEKAQQVNSNTQLYKQAGNSICVPVLEAILKQLLKEE